MVSHSKRCLELLGLLTLLPAAGCYSYHTIRPEDVQPDLNVRLRVTPEAAGHVATVMGYPTQDVSGQVVWLQQDTLLITVATPTAPEARTIQRLYQRLDVPLSQVIEVRQRTFSRGRTYACVGTAVAAVVGVTVAAFSGVFGGTTDVEPPPVDNRLVPAPLLIPVGRLRLGR